MMSIFCGAKTLLVSNDKIVATTLLAEASGRELGLSTEDPDVLALDIAMCAARRHHSLVPRS